MGVVRRIAWSYSRGTALAGCPRAFFFEYCSEGEPDLAMAPYLRKLRTLPMSAGSIVDGHVAIALGRMRARRPIGRRLAEEAVELLGSHVAASPARVEILRGGMAIRDHEHAYQNDFYGRGHRSEELESAIAQVREATEGFLSSPVIQRLARCSPDALVLPPRRPPHFLLDDVPVFAALDFVLRHGEKALIIDWKTSRRTDQSEESAQRQLGVYATYLVEGLGYRPENVMLQAVWLREGWIWGPEPARPFLLTMVQEEAREQIASLRGRLWRDVVRGESVWRADRGAFEARPSARRCIGCKFLELCGEGKVAVQ